MRGASREFLETVDGLITCLAVIQLLVSAHLRGDLCEEDFLSDFGDMLPGLQNPGVRLLPQPLQREASEVVSRICELPREAIRLASSIAVGQQVPSSDRESMLRELLALQRDLEIIRSRLAAS